MDLRVVYLIWPDGESPDKAYSFESITHWDTAREELDAAGVRYGQAVIPLLGDEDTLTYIRNELIKKEITND